MTNSSETKEGGQAVTAYVRRLRGTIYFSSKSIFEIALDG